MSTAGSYDFGLYWTVTELYMFIYVKTNILKKNASGTYLWVKISNFTYELQTVSEVDIVTDVVWKSCNMVEEATEQQSDNVFRV